MAFTDFGYDFTTGHFRIDHNGDLDIDAGVALRRKLILRRILSVPGAFYHLPRYGVGIQSKGLVNQSELFRLETRIREQLSEEASITVESVSVKKLAPGVYSITVAASFVSESRVLVQIRVSDGFEQFGVTFS